MAIPMVSFGDPRGASIVPNFVQTEEDVAVCLASLFRGDHSSDETAYHFRVRGVDQEVSLARAKIQRLLEAIGDKEINDETGLYSDNSYEIIVVEESDIPGRLLRGGRANCCF